MNSQEYIPEWVSMSKAAKEVGVYTSKISRLVKDGRLRKEQDIRDERITYVDLKQVKELFRNSPK